MRSTVYDAFSINRIGRWQPNEWTFVNIVAIELQRIQILFIREAKELAVKVWSTADEYNVNMSMHMRVWIQLIKEWWIFFYYWEPLSLPLSTSSSPKIMNENIFHKKFDRWDSFLYQLHLLLHCPHIVLRNLK